MKKLTAIALCLVVVCLAVPATAVQVEQEANSASWWGVIWDGFLELVGLKSVTAPPPPEPAALEDPPPPPPDDEDGRGYVDPNG